MESESQITVTVAKSEIVEPATLVAMTVAAPGVAAYEEEEERPFGVIMPRFAGLTLNVTTALRSSETRRLGATRVQYM
jgi:hypothetical protein